MTRYRTLQALEELRSPQQAAGATMINVLISLLMIGLGLYAGIQLQIRGMEGVLTSSNQTEALLLAEDMLERMRANREQTLNGAYAATNITALPAGQNASYVDCGVDPCNATQLRDYDLGTWRESFPESLFNISAEITANPANPEIWSVIIRWDDDRDGDTGRNCPPTSENDLECVSMEASF